MGLSEQETLHVPESLDPEEESPYLRRQKSVSVRRKRFSRRVRVALFVVGVLVPVGLVGYGLATFALTSSHFLLTSPDDIVVTGNHYASRDEILGALELPLTGNRRAGTNIFSLSLDALREKVETLAWVRTASVGRILPHGLLVHVVERTPVAFADFGGQVSLIDEDGKLLEKPDGGSFDFPVLHGLENVPSLDGRRARVALYMEFMRQLSVQAPRAGWMISEVYLSDPEDLTALLISGQQTVQVHFGQKDFLPRFRNFLALLPEIQRSNGKINSVDLRYHNQVVVDPAAPAPRAGQTAAAGGERGE